MYKPSSANDKIFVSISSTILVLHLQKNLAMGTGSIQRLETHDSRPETSKRGCCMRNSPVTGLLSLVTGRWKEPVADGFFRIK